MAESRATLSTEALERFLADRAPVAAPARLADDVLRGVVGLPQERRGLALPAFGGWSGTRSMLIPVGALVAIGLLVALLGLVYAARPQPVLPASTWVRSSIGGPGSYGFVIGGGGDSLLAVSWRGGVTAVETVWRSTDDGVTWAPLADQTPFAGSFIGGFLQLDQSVLAYGSHVDAAGKETIGTWSSDDGASWRLLSDAGSVNPLDGQQQEHLEFVVRGGPGFVAVGTATGTGYVGPTAWTSTDGVAWTRGSALGGTGTVGLVRVPEGFLALTWGDRVTSWTSADGITWSPATFPDTDRCCNAGGMANLPGGMPLGAIAVIPTGAGAAMRPSVFMTGDAAAWTPLELPAPPGTCATTASSSTCPLVATAVAADAGHVVVAGSAATAQGGPLRAVFWSSADGGQTWTVSAESPSLVLDPAQSDRIQNGVYGLYAGGPNAFYAVGTTQDAGASVWTGHPFPSSAP